MYINEICVSFLNSYDETPQPKASYGGNGLFGLHFHIYSLSLKEVRTETQIGQERGGRS